MDRKGKRSKAFTDAMDNPAQKIQHVDNGDAPAVSVIMPAYRVTEFIPAALDSVLAQTFTDYEIIVVNDGSPDTPELERALEPYRERIVYIKQENRGLSGARNTAIRHARAPLVALLDPDDLWEPNYLAVQVAAMRQDETIDVLYPNAMIFGEGAGVGREFMSVCPSNGEVTFKTLVTQQCNVMICSTMRREAVMRAGMFDETLRSSEDYDLWLRITNAGGRIAYHRTVLARYRRRPGSLSSDPVWMCEHILQVFNKARAQMTLTPDEQRTLDEESARLHAMLRFHEGKRAFFRRDTQAAISAMTEANAFYKSRKTAFAVWLLRVAPQLLLRAYDLRDRFVLRTSTKF